jgi:hypothetical protein
MALRGLRQKYIATVPIIHAEVVEGGCAVVKDQGHQANTFTTRRKEAEAVEPGLSRKTDKNRWQKTEREMKQEIKTWCGTLLISSQRGTYTKISIFDKKSGHPPLQHLADTAGDTILFEITR